MSHQIDETQEREKVCHKVLTDVGSMKTYPSEITNNYDIGYNIIF